MENEHYYVVACGRKVGIYETYEEAEKQVSGFPNNKHKKLEGLNNAYRYLIDALQSKESLNVQESETLKYCLEKHNPDEDVELVFPAIF